MSTIRRTEYCLCGSALTIAATSRMGLDKAFGTWREGHQGEGHRPATRQEAYMARIKNDHSNLRAPAPPTHKDNLMDATTCSTCGQDDISQTGEYPCPDCGLPTVWDAVDTDEKESQARDLAKSILNSVLGNDLADTWPAKDVFEYLEADGFEWNGFEWVVIGRSPWNGFDDVAIVPALA